MAVVYTNIAIRNLLTLAALFNLNISLHKRLALSITALVGARSVPGVAIAGYLYHLIVTLSRTFQSCFVLSSTNNEPRYYVCIADMYVRHIQAKIFIK